MLGSQKENYLQSQSIDVQTCNAYIAQAIMKLKLEEYVPYAHLNTSLTNKDAERVVGTEEMT